MKWLTGVIAALMTFLVLPLLVITLVITPSISMSNPAQQLDDCDNQMRQIGLLAQNTRSAQISVPNSGNNAQVVVAVGEKMHIPPQGIIVALATALQESGLKNYANDGTGQLRGDQQGIASSLQLPHDAVGRDHGSLGIMQQQYPWWGTIQELMTPAIAARKFYEALLKVNNWQNLPVTVAAQTVQGSAFPDAYAAQEPKARALYATYRGAGGATDPDDAAAAGLGANPPPGQPAADTAAAEETGNICTVLRANVKAQEQQKQLDQYNPVAQSSEAGVRAVRAAQAQIGLPYVWGGGSFDGPTGGGFDCSGLTRYAVFQATGKKIGRTTFDQINEGVPVNDLTQMLPGDLVLSNFSERGPEHVQLYAGGGQVVEAQTTGVPIKMSPFPKSRVVVRRVL